VIYVSTKRPNPGEYNAGKEALHTMKGRLLSTRDMSLWKGFFGRYDA